MVYINSVTSVWSLNHNSRHSTPAVSFWFVVNSCVIYCCIFFSCVWLLCGRRRLRPCCEDHLDPTNSRWSSDTSRESVWSQSWRNCVQTTQQNRCEAAEWEARDDTFKVVRDILCTCCCVLMTHISHRFTGGGSHFKKILYSRGL